MHSGYTSVRLEGDVGTNPTRVTRAVNIRSPRRNKGSDPATVCVLLSVRRCCALSAPFLTRTPASRRGRARVLALSLESDLCLRCLSLPSAAASRAKSSTSSGKSCGYLRRSNRTELKLFWGRARQGRRGKRRRGLLNKRCPAAGVRKERLWRRLLRSVTSSTVRRLN